MATDPRTTNSTYQSMPYVDDIVGVSPWACEMRAEIATVAAYPATVLITGPSGTGKELLARAIHAASPRAAAPLVTVDCASAAGPLFASQLFGHEKGAFTGATHACMGVFRVAAGGTVFLDEMGELESELQAKLLRVLQQRVVVPVGGVEEIAVDVRVIAATNRDLAEDMRLGRFREDLYYRLNVVSLETTSLRSRIEDIDPLIDFFLSRLEIRHGIAKKKLSWEARHMVLNYSWPGNVRELENVLERATLYCQGRILLPEHLPERIRVCPSATDGNSFEFADREELNAARDSSVSIDNGPRFSPTDDSMKWPMMAEAQCDHLLATLERTDFNLTVASRLLGIDRGTLRRLARGFGIDLSRSHPGRRLNGRPEQAQRISGNAVSA